MKFRAWNKKHKIYYYSHNKENENLSDYQRIEIFFQILHDYKDEFDLPDQYTRVKDKKGKEIYEGDILHILENGDYGGEYYAEVKYLDNFGIYGILCIDVKEISKPLTNDRVNTLFTRGFLVRNFGSSISLGEMLNIGQSRFPVCEVVGNFYENPNLMI